MATTTKPAPPDAQQSPWRRPLAVRQVLARLRRRILGYVWCEALAWTIVALGLAFWVSLTIDWMLETSVAVRALVLVVSAVAATGVFVWYGVARALHALPARHLAVLLEHANPHLNYSLVTAVELTEVGSSRRGAATLDELGFDITRPFEPGMVQRTLKEAQRGCDDIDFDGVFVVAPLLRAVATAGWLAISIFGFSLAAPESLDVWARRNILLDDAPWPRNTRLMVNGFDDGVVKVARGADFQLQVMADTSATVPNVVEVRYRSEHGGTGQARLIREGDALASGAAAQKFIHTFQSMLSSTELDIFGGDARLRDLRIEVVDSPALMHIQLKCKYPAYLERRDETLSVAGAVTIPRGTALRLVAEANKPLVRVDVASLSPAGNVETRSVDVAPSAPRQIDVELGVADTERTVALTLHDTDAIKSRKPTELIVRVADDTPPRVKVRPNGVGSAITTMAMVPLYGEIDDDHLLTDVRIAYRVDSGDWKHRALDSASPLGSHRDVDERFDVASLGLETGQQLTLEVEAIDNRALADGPQTTASEPVRLDIVSRDDLMAMLESRELNLRRRLQALIDDVARVRDSVASWTPGDAGNGQPAAADENPNESDGAAQDTASSADGIDTASLRSIRLHRARQDSHQSAEEALGIARSIEAIRDELVNNRVDSEDTKERLTAGIAEPLVRSGKESFAELDARFNVLQTTLDETATLGPLQPTRQQLDTVLRELHSVLDRMLEMETFNELVDTLRELIDTQEQVQATTQQLRRKSVLDLLGE